MKTKTEIENLINKLTPLPGTNPEVSNKYDKTGTVAALPDITLQDAIAIPIKTILGWAMIFTIIALVVAGVFYIQSRGNEDDIKKAKDILLYLVIGMAIMAAAYGIVAGLAQFNFF